MKNTIAVSEQKRLFFILYGKTLSQNLVNSHPKSSSPLVATFRVIFAGSVVGKTCFAFLEHRTNRSTIGYKWA